MAKAIGQMSWLPHSYSLQIFFLAFLLLTGLPETSRVQAQSVQSPPSPDDSPQPTANPSSILAQTLPTAGSLQSMPTSTDSANYATHNNNDAQDRGILNYYFLLLAIFVIFIALVYWSFARRRHKRNVTSRSGQQTALAQDLRTWPGRRMMVGRWGASAGQRRAEEGLDERGEAPPPYLKEPEPTHHGSGTDGTELHDMSRAEVKPPDYSERSVRS